MSMNDIEQWIDNDEGLYNWWKSERISKRGFIRKYREDLEACIDKVLNRKSGDY